MTRSVSLLFGVHAHQPAGNFEHVLDHAHARCYRPYLETVYRYPEFRFAIHSSGWLLDYLLRTYPEDMRKLQEMVARGQAELFGGGDTEPVLASIPERDRRTQIAALSDRLERAFGQRPSGAWLTERVWESAVVPSLADSGIRYVTVDDYHFLCAGKAAEELTGYFSTEEGGVPLDLFPISEALRYRIPFSPAPEAVAYLESLATEDGSGAAVYFDDIEKLGIWPETHEWVYGKKWLEQFIEGVLRSTLIRSAHYRDFHAGRRTRGVVYLPATSYIEMNEWSLPPAQAHEWADLVAQEKAANRYAARKALIRGGIWRNFIARYPESNWAHKRMLSLSARVASLPKAAITPQMQNLLHLAQANDAYWHGLFGGIYLPHLRRAVWNAIVALEALLDAGAERKAVVSVDTDHDGHDEIFLSNGELQAVIRDDGQGAIHELDAYWLRHNFGDTLARREEHYYRKILQGVQRAHDGEGIASAHDRVGFRHPIAPEDLIPDARPRAIFLDRLLRDGREVAPGYALAEAAPDHVALTSRQAGVAKIFALRDRRLRVDYVFDATPGMLESALNLAMPSCDGVLGRYRLKGEIAGGFGQSFEWRDITGLTLEDDVLGGKLVLEISEPVTVRALPHRTVSQSEEGFEKIMQAVTLQLATPRPVGALRITLSVF
ncbi:MAG TPA: alpha-amylase/4-alpha-glucanotransferase domain-containing protein [Burkholderiales bacterium]|nr:alpha-amylase/4-alpha-glucanotransferase domain-containing protein [Burkholderiales bacterium]